MPRGARRIERLVRLAQKPDEVLRAAAGVDPEQLPTAVPHGLGRGRHVARVVRRQAPVEVHRPNAQVVQRDQRREVAAAADQAVVALVELLRRAPFGEARERGREAQRRHGVDHERADAEQHREAMPDRPRRVHHQEREREHRQEHVASSSEGVERETARDQHRDVDGQNCGEDQIPRRSKGSGHVDGQKDEQEPGPDTLAPPDPLAGFGPVPRKPECVLGFDEAVGERPDLHGGLRERGPAVGERMPPVGQTDLRRIALLRQEHLLGHHAHRDADGDRHDLPRVGAGLRPEQREHERHRIHQLKTEEVV